MICVHLTVMENGEHWFHTDNQLTYSCLEQQMLIPFTMICFGRYFMKKAPKEINAVFIGSIFPTEIALKKNFDKNGKRR